MRLPLLTVLLAVPALTAQTQVSAPTAPLANVDRPFGGGIGHYQQWFAPWTLNTGMPSFTTPVRIDQIEFFAGLSQSSLATTIDMEVSVGHGKTFGLGGAFASNFDDTPVVVLPRQNVQLLAGTPQSVVMTIPFATQFTWDWTRPILVDIKIFGNSRGNQPFTYNNLGTVSAFQATMRNYSSGSATAASGLVQQSIGLITRFQGRDGVVLEFGNGCPGEGSFVPDNTIQNLPWPGIAWSHQLSNAPSQRTCMWMIGDSRQAFGSTVLPVDVGTLLGFAPNGCMLLQNAVSSVWTTTVGSGPGAGIASVTVNLPAVTSYVGVSVYTQWFVLDPMSPNGLMAASEGGWAIIAPVGG